MSYKDMSIGISYTSVGEDAFYTVLNPLLSQTKIYKRSVGYFSSSALNFIGDGILNLARNGGHIYLATSPQLSEDDVEAIKEGYDYREKIKNAFLNELEDSLVEISDYNASILYQLIKENILDIKIVRKKNGIYHDKLALLEDFEGNRIACVGSYNESGPGYSDNYEKVRVYKSWTDVDGRVEDETNEFNSIWENDNDYLEVFDFKDAIENKIIERVEHKGSFEKRIFKYEMRQYQIEAKNRWVENGYKGFFVMATGTGKTITSLNSIKELITNESVFTVIAVPYKHLVNQWYEDVCTFFPNAYVQLVHGEIQDAENNISTFIRLSNNDKKPVIVVTTISSFLLDKYMNLFSSINRKKLLIVDEAHNFFNQLSDDLDNQYIYKLGLSATPVFGSNEDKTKVLLDWFGGLVYEYPLEDAIGKYLVNYNYVPYFVNSTENDEFEFNKYTQIMLSAVDHTNNTIIDQDKFLRGYLGRLRTISMAEEKINKISNIFSNIDNFSDHTIVYCSDGKMFDDDGSEKRHLESVLEKINFSLLGKNIKDVKASKFTASENVKTRMELIDNFNKGIINCLVAIKCLDEGINIPSIKNALILSSNDNYREFVQRRGRILRLYKDDSGEKKYANIYDVIVLPSVENKNFAEIEFRRYYEYAKLALNKDDLLNDLSNYLTNYGLSIDDIKFKNDYLVGDEIYE